MNYTQNCGKNKVFLNYLYVICKYFHILGPSGPFALAAEGALGACAFFAGASFESLSSATLAFQQVLSTSLCGAFGSAAAAFNNSEILASSILKPPGDFFFPQIRLFCRLPDLGNTPFLPLIPFRFPKSCKSF
jgi:hypothetical protein